MSVYRLHDATGALLYVGLTARGLQRLNEHLHAQPWWQEVSVVSFEHYSTRQEAADRERAIISTERPRCNIALVIRPGRGEHIKRVRERKVFGQAELARKAGISPNTLYRIEAGDHDPRPVTIRKIAEALGIDPGELVGGTA